MTGWVAFSCGDVSHAFPLFPPPPPVSLPFQACTGTYLFTLVAPSPHAHVLGSTHSKAFARPPPPPQRSVPRASFRAHPYLMPVEFLALYLHTAFTWSSVSTVGRLSGFLCFLFLPYFKDFKVVSW